MLFRSNEEIRVQAVLTDLPDNIYPAANVSIEFDKDKLELVDFTIGTMKVYDDYDEASDDEPKFKIPQWTYNLDMANEQGIINAMYLDTTVGKNAYSKDGFKKGKNDILFSDYLLKKLIIILILFMIGVLVETYISPSLIKIVAAKFYM